MVYFGGFGDRLHLWHLCSRYEMVLLLREYGSLLIYFCVGMVVGLESEFYCMLRYLV